MNFPVGSKVVTTKTNRSYEKGWEGKVVQVDTEEPTHLVSFEQAVAGLWTHSYDLKLVEPTQHEFKVGDKVEVLESSTWHEVGPGEVTEADSGLLQVKQTQHYGKGFWISTKYVRPLAEEPAKTELKFEVGARVRGNNRCDHAEGTVTRLEGPFGGDIEIAWDMAARYLSSMTLGALRENLEVTAPAPKTEKKKATLVDDKNKPQIGDTIVAFWENNGVEYRQKGVVARIDSDGTLATAEHNHINVASNSHSYSYGGFAPHVYIVERTTKPEPVKVDPNQKWIDAPIGSIAKHTSMDFVWRKTANNEWSLLTSSGNVIRDRNDSTIGAGARAVLFTP